MPWDGCELSVATFDGGGAVAKATVIAGGRDESIAQPVWGPDGTLYFVSDRSGYWNIYRFAGTDVADTDGIVSPVLVRENDFAKPAWVFGITTYDVLDAGHLAVTYADRGEWRLAVLDTETGELRDVATPYTEFDDVSVAGGRVLAVAASPTRTEEIVSIDPASGPSRCSSGPASSTSTNATCRSRSRSSFRRRRRTVSSRRRTRSSTRRATPTTSRPRARSRR